MKFSKEQIMKAAECKSAEELIALAKAEGMDMTAEEAQKCFEALSTSEIKLDDLGAVVGGGGVCAGNVCGYDC